MKNLIVLKITKSLCAFFLIFALLICANPMALYAEELTETEETTSTEETTETTTEEITTTETTSETTTTETISEETTTAESTSEETTTEETTTEESVELIAEGEEGEEEEGDEGEEEEGEKPTGPVAAENAADPEDGYKIYKYMINIEYGTLSFYYDWGIWDTDYCMYTAEKSSFGPSKETQENTAQLRNNLQGQLQNVTEENLPKAPGWYGFDGTANKISITNLSGGSADVYVRFDYNYETDGFNTSDVFPRIVQPTVTYYFDEEMSASCGTQAENGNYQIMKIPYSEIDSQSKEHVPTNIYVSLSGAPYEADMNGASTEGRYHADTATQIGFLTVTVGVSPESLLPSPTQSFSLRDEEEELELIESTVTEETTTVETTSAEETTTAETISAEETTTAETTSAEETTTVETTSAEETTTVETTSAEETTTAETTSAEDTTTVETTSAEKTTTAETTFAVETTTVEISSMEEPTTQEQISTE